MQGASGLDPEGVDILVAELESRGMDPALRAVIEAQTRTLTPAEVDALIHGIRHRPCPECGRSDQLLNAGVVASAKSFVVVSFYKAPIVVACPSCLKKQSQRALAVTSVLGWWGIPWGPIYSIRSLYHNTRTLSAAKRPDPSEALREYVTTYPGLATAIASAPAEA